MANTALCMMVFNIIVAAILSSVMTWLAVKYKTYRELSPQVLTLITVTCYTSNIVNALGYIVIFCLGKDLRRSIKVGLSFILILVFVACSIATIVVINTRFLQDARDALDSYQIGEIEFQVWDHIQVDFKCCGINDYSDWMEHGNYGSNRLPDSCCISPVKDCGKTVLAEQNRFSSKSKSFFTKSCIDAGFFTYFYTWAYIISGVTIFMNVLNLIVVIITGQDSEGFETED